MDTARPALWRSGDRRRLAAPPRVIAPGDLAWAGVEPTAERPAIADECPELAGSGWAALGHRKIEADIRAA
jgi:hypothetical protein